MHPQSTTPLINGKPARAPQRRLNLDWSDPQVRAAYYREWHDRPEARAQRKAFREKNRERLAAKSKAYHEANKERANANARTARAAAHQREPEANPARNRTQRAALRAELLAAYGGKCACCGEAEPAFLQLDHVNGGGRKEYREAGGCSTTVHRRLRREGWPPGYQVLCANCNYAKAFSPGGCPHQALNPVV